MKVKLLILSLLLFLGGCDSSNYILTKKSNIDAKISAARIDTETKLKTLNDLEVQNLNNTIAEKNKQLQSASDHLFKGEAVSSILKFPTRPEKVMGESIAETAIQLPSATLEAQNEAFKNLQDELNEEKINDVQLQSKYDNDMAIAKKDANDKNIAINNLTQSLKSINDEKNTVLDSARKQEGAFSDERHQKDNEIISAQQNELNAKSANEKLKKWLMGVFVTIAIASGIGAAFSPIVSLRFKLALAALICTGGAIAIPFITPIFVMSIITILIIGVGIWIAIDYHHEHADATDTYRALNQLKTQNPTTYQSTVAPTLQEWQTDPKTGQRINNRLKQVGDV